MSKLARPVAPGQERSEDPIGDAVIAQKRVKYASVAQRLSHRGAPYMVFLALPINALGRLHPTTRRTYSYFIQKAADRSAAQAFTVRDEYWQLDDGDNEREPWESWRLSTYQRNKWCALAVILQNELVEKVSTTMVRYCRAPGVRAAPLARHLASQGVVWNRRSWNRKNRGGAGGPARPSP